MAKEPITEEDYPLASIDRSGLHIVNPKIAETVRNKKLSPSAISGVLDCGARWAAGTFVLPHYIQEPADNPRTRGSAFHKVMEDLFHLPPEERTKNRVVKIVRNVLNSEEFKELGESPEAVQWLRQTVNGYYRLNIEDPETVEIAELVIENTQRKGLEIFVSGEIGSAKRSVLGFVDRITKDPDVEDGYIVEDWKGLALDTPLLTPHGWKTMGDVREGEYIAGTQSFVQVVGKSQVQHRDCYELIFSNGERIVSDSVHIWKVNVHHSDGGVDSCVLSANELYEVLHDAASTSKVSVVALSYLPLSSRPVPVPVEDYAQYYAARFGKSNSVSAPDLSEDRKAKFEAVVLDDRYLMNSMEVRYSFVNQVAKILGEYTDNENVVSFHNKEAATAFGSVVASLGYAYDLSSFGAVHTVSWNENLPVQEVDLVGMEQVDSVPTQCIKVKAKDSLFLCGKSLVPTHNTGGKIKRWNSKSKDTQGLAEVRQQFIYAMLLRDMGVNITKARLIFPFAGGVIDVPLDSEQLRDRVISDVHDADRAWQAMEESNTYDFKPSVLCAWCPLAKICPEATILPNAKCRNSYEEQPSPEELGKGITIL